MFLILTGSDDATADYLETRFRDARLPSCRLNTDHLIGRWDVGYDRGAPWLAVPDLQLAAKDVSSVWFRRPTELTWTAGGDEAERRHIAGEWTAAIEGFLAHVPDRNWINHPANNARAAHKIEQLSRAQHFGLAVPETIVTRSPDMLRQFMKECRGDVVMKPLLSGYIERDQPESDTLIYTSRVRDEHLRDVDAVLPKCPTLFQKLVHKAIDVRVTVVDNDFHIVGLVARDASGEQRLDIRRNNMADVQYEQLSIPEKVRVSLCQLIQSYHLRFAAADFAVTSDGSWTFFEINPNGQWAWQDLAGVTDIAKSFIRVGSHGR